MPDRRTATLRAVVERTEPRPCSISPAVEERYECGHGEHHAPVTPAKRRRCGQCVDDIDRLYIDHETKGGE